MNDFVEWLAFERSASRSTGANADPEGLLSVALNRAEKEDMVSKGG
jgi:hypothetical protein